jgi:hypothetical protein
VNRAEQSPPFVVIRETSDRRFVLTVVRDGAELTVPS